jgi:threonine dehydrogenase-like Zn-dependent dehydrogenase
MDKRTNTRVKTHQLARVCGKMGVVNNMSLKGLQVATALLPKTRKVDVSFEALGKEITVNGTVQWFRRKTSVNSLNQLGIVVKDAPIQYYQMLERLADE